ncbi:hypothetical protein WG66_004191 [Moniliophthora roreri]|nr:hypothetical protein WG66_004191 [Moniliophthora roreri]
MAHRIPEVFGGQIDAEQSGRGSSNSLRDPAGYCWRADRKWQDTVHRKEANYPNLVKGALRSYEDYATAPWLRICGRTKPYPVSLLPAVTSTLGYHSFLPRRPDGCWHAYHHELHEAMNMPSLAINRLFGEYFGSCDDLLRNTPGIWARQSHKDWGWKPPLNRTGEGTTFCHPIPDVART